LPTTDADPTPRPAPSVWEETGARRSRLVVAGYVLSIVMPIAGLIVGVVLVNRPERRAVKLGVWMIGLSVLVGFLLFVVLIVSVHPSSGGIEGG
jgi:hypothetical protein